MRPVLNTARRAAIPIDLKRVMATKSNDYPLLPNDVLFVPSHKSRFKGGKTLLQVVPFVTGTILLIISRI